MQQTGATAEESENAAGLTELAVVEGRQLRRRSRELAPEHYRKHPQPILLPSHPKNIPAGTEGYARRS